MKSLETEIEIPDFPTHEAKWAPVYLEPIVESGEFLTIGVVASDGSDVEGKLTVTDKALQCLYGETASGMRTMMELALQRALHYAKNGFDKSYTPGIHGVLFGPSRDGLGENLQDIIEQGISLTSSLSQVHAEESRSAHDRTTYWKRVQKAMERVDKNLVNHFGHHVDVAIRGSSISIACDYFSSRIAVNVCSLSADYRANHLFDAATSKVFKLEQLKDHDALLRHDQRATMMLVIPSESQLDSLKPASRKSFDDRILLLQDMADKRNFGIASVHNSLDGAKHIRDLEYKVA